MLPSILGAFIELKLEDSIEPSCLHLGRHIVDVDVSCSVIEAAKLRNPNPVRGRRRNHVKFGHFFKVQVTQVCVSPAAWPWALLA